MGALIVAGIPENVDEDGALECRWYEIDLFLRMFEAKAQLYSKKIFYGIQKCCQNRGLPEMEHAKNGTCQKRNSTVSHYWTSTEIL